MWTPVQAQAQTSPPSLSLHLHLLVTVKCGSEGLGCVGVWGGLVEGVGKAAVLDERTSY
jgi:hypothetical protein